MSTTTKIEWTDKTWNPTVGCDRVSPGCDRCYAMGVARIREFNPNPKIQEAFAGTTSNDGGVDWTGKVNLLDGRLAEPLGWRKPAKVFVNSMSDLFHKDVPDGFIARVFAVMAITPQHTYQVLTKRHGRMKSLLSSEGFRIAVKDAYTVLWGNGVEAGGRLAINVWPLPNVWLGVSVENQKWADTRIPALLQTPAAVRFLSCEPLLGPIDLGIGDPHRDHDSDDVHGAPHPRVCLTCSTEDGGEVEYFRRESGGNGIDWVIVGGESGNGARAMHPDWARDLRDQCVEAKVPYLFKQWGEWGPAEWSVRVCDPAVGWLGTAEELVAAKAASEAVGATHAFTGNWYEEDGERKYELYEPSHKPWSLERGNLPEYSAPMRRWGKKAAGRELDGRTWDEFPEAVSSRG